MHAIAEIERQTADVAVVAAIRGQELTALVLGMAVWAEAVAARPNALDNDRMEKRLGTLAPSLLDSVDRKARKRARHIGGLSAEELHRLRKSLKRLLCDVGSFATLFRHRATKNYSSRCEHVLEILGEINDAVVTQRLTRTLLTDSRPALVESGEALVRWSKRRDRSARRGLRSALKNFRAAPAFWS